MAECDHLWKEIYGNERLKDRLASEIESGKLTHAYLVEGAPGSGRFLLSRTLCALLSANLRDAERIMVGLCPDIHIIEQPVGRRTIGIDQIRALRTAASVKPSELEFQAFIIRNAHLMTVQAQNALLKLLEEPPGPILFLLLCDNASSMLTTVRSRAPVLRMQSFSADELKACLTSDASFASPEAKMLASRDPVALGALLKGCATIGAAKAALTAESRSAEDPAKTALTFWQAVADKKTADITLAAIKAPSDREGMGIFLRCARTALRDLAALRQSGEHELLFGYEDDLRALARKMPIRLIVQLDELILSLQRDLASNANLNNLKTALAVGCRKIAC